MYLLIYLLNDGQLPWDNFYQRFKKNKNFFKDMLMERLQLKYSKLVLEMAPHRLKPLMKEIFRLKFKEEPPYNKLLKELKAAMIEEQKLWNMVNPLIGCHQFEWVLQHQGFSLGRNPENYFQPKIREYQNKRNF